jgi:hypothetical protein
LEKLNSDLVKDQFKNLRNNINLELENVIDEEDDDEYIEDEEFVMKPQGGNVPFKLSPNKHPRLNSSEDISKIDNLVKRMNRRRTEEIIFDCSVDKEKLYENEIDIKFKEENTKEDITVTSNKINAKLTTLNGDHEVPYDTHKEINTAPAFRSLRSNDIIKKSVPEVKCNCKGKFNEYNKHISFFVSKLIKLSQTCSQTVKWIDQSYKWIEERYLSNFIKDTKKSLIKRSKIQE